jgi:hypothetical protein
MLPEVQIVKHDLAAGARRRYETSASASATSETLALCRIGKQYAVREDLGVVTGERQHRAFPVNLNPVKAESRILPYQLQNDIDRRRPQDLA